MTGLPFVFATWLCPVDMAPEQLTRVRSTALILDRIRRRNAFRLPELASSHAARFGWPEDLARHYFVDLLRYELDEEAREGLRLFLDMAVGLDDSIRLLDWT
jgi:predicted solute-binding protein